MAKTMECIVEGCKNQAHAKGYCRRHYGQIWRKGHIDSDDSLPAKEPRTASRHDDDRMRALERELRKAENMYRQVVGFEGRLKWRKEMEAVKKEIAHLTVAEPVAVGQ